VALGYIFIHVVRFSYVSIVLEILHIHISGIYEKRCTTLANAIVFD